MGLLLIVLTVIFHRPIAWDSSAKKVSLDAGLVHGHDRHLASGVVDRNCATLRGVAVCIELAAVSTRLLDCALSGVQADHIISRAHWLTRFITGSVNGFEDAGFLRFAIGAREIILAIGVDDTALGVVEKFSGLSATVIVDVNLFCPVG